MLQHNPSKGKGRNGIQHSMVNTADGEPVQTRGSVPGILLHFGNTEIFCLTADAAAMVQGQQVMAIAGSTDLFRAHPF